MNEQPMTMAALRCLALVAALAAAPAVRAHDAHATRDTNRVAKAAGGGDAAVGVDAPAPELSARWRVRFEPRGARAQEQTWALHRGRDRIVWSKGMGLDEVWQRDASGISLRRVMHPQRHVIEYTAGELRTLGVEKGWHDLGELYSERDLAALELVGVRTRDGLQRLHGTVAGEQIDLLWDPQARLPVTLVQTTALGRVRFERLAVELGADAAQSWSGDARAADYTRIDAADFGDMEGEPVVRMAMAFDHKLGWRRAHRH
jgi:hypothetical protein